MLKKDRIEHRRITVSEYMLRYTLQAIQTWTDIMCYTECEFWTDWCYSVKPL